MRQKLQMDEGLTSLHRYPSPYTENAVMWQSTLSKSNQITIKIHRLHQITLHITVL